MYKFKRIFALMISAAVMTCFMTVSAKDAFNDVDVNSGCFNAVTMLSGMNVVQGDGYGNFNPERFVSRSRIFEYGQRGVFAFGKHRYRFYGCERYRLVCRGCGNLR